MLDQSFSSENFRTIFDIENRRGNYLEAKFFPDIAKVSAKIQALNAKIKKEKPGLKDDELGALYDQLNELKEEKEELLTSKLNQVSENLTTSTFSPNLRVVQNGSAKPIYSLNDTAENFFALKQVQWNIKKVYKVKQSNRRHLICQLREILSDKMPKMLIRSDLSSFYESVPRDKIIQKIDEDALLNVHSRRAIKKILHEYAIVSGAHVGIPRGVGVSAYLSELYMRKVDQYVKSLSGVLYYARYVDDIVLILKPFNDNHAKQTLVGISKILREMGLTRNRTKTEFKSNAKNSHFTFDYLGYEIAYKNGLVDLSISKKKMNKIRERVDLSFTAYLNSSPYHEKRERNLLIKRLKFITGNTRLHNNKKNVMAGIYYNNNLITQQGALTGLDSFLTARINKLSNSRLKKKLTNLSFSEGFTQKSFYQFSASDLNEIVKVWKNV